MTTVGESSIGANCPLSLVTKVPIPSRDTTLPLTVAVWSINNSWSSSKEGAGEDCGMRFGSRGMLGILPERSKAVRGTIIISTTIITRSLVRLIRFKLIMGSSFI